MAALQKLFQYAFGAALAAILLLMCAHSGVMAALAAVVLMVFLSRWETPHFAVWLFCASFASRAIMAACVAAPVTSDFALMLASAREWAQGSTAFASQAYYQLWPYQLPFTWVEMLLVRICDSESFLQLVNCVVMAGSNALVYLTARETATPRAARMAALLYLIYPSALCLAPVLTNQHFGAFFLLAAMWVFLARRLEPWGIWRYALAGVLAALGNLMRPEAVILLTALGAYTLFMAVREKNVKALGKWAARFLVLLLGFACVMAGANAAVRTAGLHADGLRNQNPLWKFVLGLNVETGGQYSVQDAADMLRVYMQDGAGEALDTYEKRVIVERLGMPAGEWRHLLREKVKTMWVKSALSWGIGHFREGGTLHLLWGGKVDGATVYAWMEEADFGVRAVMTLLAFWGTFMGARRKRTEMEHAVRAYAAPFVVFASFCAFLLVEVQGRYAYMPHLFMAVCAAAGVDMLTKKSCRGEEKTE